MTSWTAPTGLRRLQSEDRIQFWQAKEGLVEENACPMALAALEGAPPCPPVLAAEGCPVATEHCLVQQRRSCLVLREGR